MTARPPASPRFSRALIAALREEKILGMRAGTEPHRFIGIWVVVVGDRVFVRSWGLHPRGWHSTLVKQRLGVISVEDRQIAVRAIRTRSESLLRAVDRAYREKYHTPGSIRYVRGFERGKRRLTTTELAPLARAAKPAGRG